MKKKVKSTYEEFIEDEEQKTLLDKEYEELLLSELLMAVMQHDHVSVRKLAAAAGVSPTIIQGLKSGTKTNITVDTLSRILDAVGYKMIFTPKERTHNSISSHKHSLVSSKYKSSHNSHI